jgi:hypothetical protein
LKNKAIKTIGSVISKGENISFSSSALFHRVGGQYSTVRQAGGEENKQIYTHSVRNKT